MPKQTQSRLQVNYGNDRSYRLCRFNYGRYFTDYARDSEIASTKFHRCALFVTYGLAIDAWPVVLTNSFIAVVNVYYLTKLYQSRHSE